MHVHIFILLMKTQTVLFKQGEPYLELALLASH